MTATHAMTKPVSSLSDRITVVSGLPRSGTSMMMNMLQQGGFALLLDEIREADESNPKGYYEFEKVKKLPDDISWLEEAKGRAVKVISQLVMKLPPQYEYSVLFMRRDLDEILASQDAMVERLGAAQPELPEGVMADLFKRHIEEVTHWLAERPNFATLYVNYNDVVRDAQGAVAEINDFLGGGLDESRMLGVVDRSLHRQRSGETAGQ